MRNQFRKIQSKYIEVQTFLLRFSDKEALSIFIK